MPDFGRGELHDLAQTANLILSDELALHGFNVSAQDGAINGGMVRAVAEALDNAGYLVMLKRHPEGSRRLMYGVPTDGKGEHAHFDSVTPEGKRIRILGGRPLGPAPEIAEPPHKDGFDASAILSEDVAMKVAVAPSDGATPAQSDHELHPTWTPEQHALYRQAADAIRELARDGYMPTQGEWNTGKPADLPKWDKLLRELGCTWRELAQKLGLRRRKPGPRKQHPEGSRSLVAKPHKTAPGRPLGADTPPKSVPRLRGTLEVDENGLVAAAKPDAMAVNADGRPVRLAGSFDGT